jgi:hypothetical protein
MQRNRELRRSSSREISIVIECGYLLAVVRKIHFRRDHFHHSQLALATKWTVGSIPRRSILAPGILHVTAMLLVTKNVWLPVWVCK